MNRAKHGFDVTSDDIHRYNFALAQFRQLGHHATELIKRGDFSIYIKADGTPVTNIDKEIEERFTEAVNVEYGGEDIVLGEELSADTPIPEDKRIWRLDPLDGTGWLEQIVKAGSYDYSTLRALLLTAHFRPGETTPCFGVIHSPFYDKSEATISSIDGGTYYHNAANPAGRKVSVRRNAPTDITKVARYERNGLHNATQDVSEEELAKIMPLAERIKMPLFMGNLALHVVDISLFPGPSQPHDVAAGALAVINAGGIVKDFDGHTFDQIDWRRAPINGVIASSSEDLVDQVIAHYATR